LIEPASLASALTDALRRRGVGGPSAGLAAEAGVAVFKIAFDEWVTEPGRRSLSDGIRAAVDERRVVTGGRAPAARPARPPRSRR
jgi:hypothetical protein